MSTLSRTQLLVYGAVAIAVLLVGARWVRGAQERGTEPGGIAYAAGAESESESESESGSAPSGALTASTDGEDLVVHVAGAVRDPGVYRLPEGSRVTDAVERAGGPGPKAALDAINLAASLADGQQVVLPARDSGAGGSAPAGAAPDGPISLGSATLEQLDTIEGIGPVTAQNIIDFRTENGGISSVEDLDEISGIGPATMEALRSSVQP